MRHENSAAERIRKARTALLLDHPFFGSLLFRLKSEEERAIPTMATNGVVLRYNPVFVDTLNSATLTSQLQPGKLVSLRGREWVVLPSDDPDNLLVVKPLGGSDDEVTGIYLPLDIRTDLPVDARFP